MVQKNLSRLIKVGISALEVPSLKLNQYQSMLLSHHQKIINYRYYLLMRLNKNMVSDLVTFKETWLTSLFLHQINQKKLLFAQTLIEN